MPIKKRTIFYSLFLTLIFLPPLFAEINKTVLSPIASLCVSALKHHPKIQSAYHKARAGTYAYAQTIDRFKPHLSIS